MEKKTVIARMPVAEGKEKEYLALVSPLIEATRAEPGNLVYTLYRSTQNPLEYLVYEEYTDEAAFNGHSTSDHFRAFAGQVGDYLDGEIDIQVF